MKKWGVYLRAPDSFLRVMEERPNLVKKLSTLVDIKFGTLTGWNGFYCPSPRSAAYDMLQAVHPSYRIPLIRTIKHVGSFVAADEHCEGSLFVCDDSKSKLKGKGVRNYIAWAEKQKQRGVFTYKSGEMARRDPWYSTRSAVKGNVIFPMFVGDKHFTINNPKEFAITNNLLAGTVRKKKHRSIVHAVTNSSWFALCCELYGRINLGEGALKIEKADLDELPMPDFDLFTPEDIKTFERAFKLMHARQPLPLAEEARRSEKQTIDRIVCRALRMPVGAETEIQDSAIQLCAERELVSEMRRDRATERVKRDIADVTDEIVQQVLPDGPKTFPDDFISAAVKSKEIRIPSSGLEVIAAPRARGQADIFSGRAVYRVRAVDGYSAEFDDPETVEYVHFAQNGTKRTIRAPAEPQEMAQAVSAYKKYIQDLELALEQAVRERVLDGKLVRGIVHQIMGDLGLRIEELKMGRSRKELTG